MQKLLEKIENLPADLKEIFNRIYEIKIYDDKMTIPEKLKNYFVGAENQQIVAIANKILHQETTFNLWRAKRRESANPAISNEQLIASDNCPFCRPKEFTPEDEIGRLENESAITGSNIADSLKYHSLVIFKKHNFPDLKKNDIVKTFELSNLWFEKIAQFDKNQSYGFLIWNQGREAAASISHPHLQIFAKETLPEKFEFIKEKIFAYQQQFNSNYYDDLFLIHKDLSLAKEINSLKIIISLTPFKDKETIFLGKWTPEDLYKIFNAWESLAESFNVFLFKEPYHNLPSGFIVDRGALNQLHSDIGTLEIYAFSVVGFDILDFAKRFLSAIE